MLSPNAPEPAQPALANAQLLFGIIALQTGLVTSDQLVAAFHAWTSDKSRTLADIFADRSVLTADERQALERLVRAFLKKHGDNPEQSLAALSSIADARQQLERLNDPDVSASLAHVSQNRPTVPDEEAATLIVKGGPSVATAAPLLSRFRIIRPHAKGGLGQVSVALDAELHREVALKEIQPQHADDPTSRERFLLEAEITGGLEHPGIVPVYALGQGPDGRPFYAMRFIKGDSLKTAIEAYHSPNNPHRNDPGARQFELRRLLGRFIDVCNAMEYAHSRGVLHRDLKPGNIMVGKYGETLVVDWGLAKSVERGELVSHEGTLRPTSALSSSGQTQHGSAIGTPAYMSPEQAAGKLDELGPASDVYSLGATLYHLLCGRPPFEKQHVAEILTKVQKADFAPPRSILPQIPRALEAICLKAMSLIVAERYATVRALADDVEHWLADEPIVAAPDSFTERVGRLARKHRGYVRAAGATLVAVALVSSIAAWLINRAREQAVLAESAATKERDKALAAETNERKARQEAVHQQQIAQENEQAAIRLRALADERAANLRRSLARNYFDHGFRDYAAGHPDSALADLLRAFVAAAPDDPLRVHYRDILADRCLQGGKQLTPRLRHADSVFSVAFSANGTRVVTGSSDQTARLWDARTGVPLSEPLKHAGPVSSVAVSSDGTRVVTGSFDGTARLWNGRTGAPMGEPLRHAGMVNSVALSADAARVLTGSDDKTARLWDGQTGAPIGEPLRHADKVNCVAFRADGGQVVTGSADKTARLWNAETGAPMAQPLRHADSITCVAFNVDGTRVVTGSADQTARLWNNQTGAPIAEPLKHAGWVNSVAFSPDGTRLVTGSDDKTARLWDTHRGAPIGEPLRHDGRVTGVAFSPDGTRVLTGSTDKTAQLWDAQTGAPLGDPLRHEREVYCVGFSTDGTRVATGSADATARLWNAQSNAPIGKPLNHGEVITSVAVSSDGTRMITGSYDLSARLWDVPMGSPVGEPLKHVGTVTSVAFSVDGLRVVTASSDRTAQLWDARTGLKMGPPLMHDELVDSVAFSRDGLRVLTGSTDKKARLWNVQTGELIGKPLLHPESVTSVDLNFDATRAVTGCADRSARLWDLQTGTVLGEPLTHERWVTSVSFSPDGTRVATGSIDKTARLWEAQSGTLLGQPLRHDNWVTSLAFNSAGTRIVTGSVDKTARLWDAHTGAPIGTPLRHDDTITGVAFFSDGTRVATGCGDGMARIWDVAEPAFGEVPASVLDQAFRLWTGYRADEAGRLHRLTSAEIDETRQSLGENDPLLRFATDHYARLTADIHRR